MIADLVHAVGGGLDSVQARSRAALARIAATDPDIRAWVRTVSPRSDEDASPAQGPLVGSCFGVKDVFTTAALPTSFGVEGDTGLDTGVNAGCVQRLVDAGATMIGKTVTAELATYTPGPTRNPHNQLHTPGGSSSGSAAAVAAGHVDFALGTQTAGSVIRPASFCGVWGYKPTMHRYPDDGMLETCTALDTAGFFATCIEDVALLDAVLSDREEVAPTLPDALQIAVCAGPGLSLAQPALREHFAAALQAVRDAGHRVVDVDLEPIVSRATTVQSRLHLGGVARSLGWLCERSDLSLSERFRQMVSDGREINDHQWLALRDEQRQLAQQFDSAMAQVDVVMTLAAPGPAPRGLHHTGDPICNRAWTALGVPCIAVPCWRIDGMPVALQLVARADFDQSLIAAAALLSAVVAAPETITQGE